MCNNPCTVLGKNALNGYTEIHQSILNSYSFSFLSRNCFAWCCVRKNLTKIAKFGLLVTDCSFLSKINLTVLQSWKQNVGFKFSFKKLFRRVGSKMLVFSFLSRNCFAEWVTKCWFLVFFQETFSQGEEQNVRYSLLSRICFAWCCVRKNLTKVAKFFISQNLHAWFKKCVTTKKFDPNSIWPVCNSFERIQTFFYWVPW